MGKCIYCKGETEKTISYIGFNGIGKEEITNYCCSDEHYQEIIKFNNYVNKNGVKFIVLVLILSLSTCATIPLAFFVKNLYIAVLIGYLPIFLLATIIVKYPFVTPETTQRYGMEKTIKTTKIIGHWGQLYCVIFAVVTTVIGILV